MVGAPICRCAKCSPRPEAQHDSYSSPPGPSRKRALSLSSDLEDEEIKRPRLTTAFSYAESVNSSFGSEVTMVRRPSPFRTARSSPSVRCHSPRPPTPAPTRGCARVSYTKAAHCARGYSAPVRRFPISRRRAVQPPTRRCTMG